MEEKMLDFTCSHFLPISPKSAFLNHLPFVFLCNHSLPFCLFDHICSQVRFFPWVSSKCMNFLQAPFLHFAEIIFWGNIICDYLQHVHHDNKTKWLFWIFLFLPAVSQICIFLSISIHRFPIYSSSDEIVKFSWPSSCRTHVTCSIACFLLKWFFIDVLVLIPFGLAGIHMPHQVHNMITFTFRTICWLLDFVQNLKS